MTGPVGHHLPELARPWRPAATETVHATYTTTQADVDAGSINNTARPPAPRRAARRSPRPSTLTVAGHPEPLDHAVKSASITALLGRRHPGHLQLQGHQHRQRDPHPVAVTDPMDRALGHRPAPTPPWPRAATETCTATYTTHPGRRRRRVDHQHRHGHGHPAERTRRSPPPRSVTIPATQAPALSVVKSATSPSYSAAGTPITYSYKVTNTGNVTLTRSR